jgi:hypothetical protein
MIATLSSLAWVATASAECAWVLWSYAVGKGMDLHSIELAQPMTQPKREVE